MGRMYSVEFENVTVSAAQDLFALKPATDKPIEIHAVYLDQISDVGDAAEEMLRLRIIRGHTTIGSGGANPTPARLAGTEVASGITTNSRTNDTTIASSGTPINLHSGAFNIRTGWVYQPTPECRPGCAENNGFIVVRLMAAPADPVVMSGTLYYEEVA